MTDLLKLRKEMKKRKPDFTRQDIKKLSLKKKWRQPKGMHSKLRRKLRGHMPHPSMGFSSPKEVRFLHPSGLKPIMVSNKNQLNEIKEKQGVVISRKVGQKKKIELIKKVKELKLTLLNIKNPDEFIKKVEEIQKKKKETQETKKTKKEKRKKEAEKKTKEKEEKTKEKTPEEKQKEEKKEKRKVLEGKK